MNNFLLILLLGLCLKKIRLQENCFYDSGNGRGYRSYKHTAFSQNSPFGASGVVFMFILLSSFVNFKKGRIPITFILVVIIYLGGEVMNGIL